MKTAIRLLVCGVISLALSRDGWAGEPPSATPQPNVLFIAVDDLNHWVGYLGRNPQTITPNIDRLAKRGVWFTRSYCAAPVCNPSRAALMSGLRPGSTGVYDNQENFQPVIPEAIRAYLATINFCDTMVGRLLGGLDQSPYATNTIICFWSDHGWHLGEKHLWRKLALWEETTRAPHIWVVPGLTQPNSRCDRTVDFMSIYPTLLDLCALPRPAHVQGQSIRSLLADPRAPWDQPAVTTFRQNNHTVRSEGWRYTYYADDGEELYDEIKDPYEWTNLARNTEVNAIKSDLGRWLPKENKPAAKGTDGSAREGPKRKGQKKL
jgi:arylsulfatase A-like enzyme